MRSLIAASCRSLFRWRNSIDDLRSPVARACLGSQERSRSYGALTDGQQQHGYIIPVSAAKDFVTSTMVATGAKESHAIALANVLVMADERGHYSHGLNRLGMFFVVR